MNYVDYYLVEPNGQEQDFALAESLVRGDEDAEWYMDSILAVLRDGMLDPDDGVTVVQHDGQAAWLFPYHNGVGDGGSLVIANSEWMAQAHPQAFAALGVRISWGRGTAVLNGQVTGQV